MPEAAASSEPVPTCWCPSNFANSVALRASKPTSCALTIWSDFLRTLSLPGVDHDVVESGSSFLRAERRPTASEAPWPMKPGPARISQIKPSDANAAADAADPNIHAGLTTRPDRPFAPLPWCPQRAVPGTDRLCGLLLREREQARIELGNRGFRALRGSAPIQAQDRKQQSEPDASARQRTSRTRAITQAAIGERVRVRV